MSDTRTRNRSTKISIRIDDDVRQYLDDLKQQGHHESLSSVVRELIINAQKAHRTEKYLQAMEQRLNQKLDTIAELADF